MEVNGSRREPRLLRFGHNGYSILEAIACRGLGRRKYKGDLKLHLAPNILEQLRHNFANSELLTNSTVQGSPPEMVPYAWRWNSERTFHVLDTAFRCSQTFISRQRRVPPSSGLRGQTDNFVKVFRRCRRMTYKCLSPTPM